MAKLLRRPLAELVAVAVVIFIEAGLGSRTQRYRILRYLCRALRRMDNLGRAWRGCRNIGGANRLDCHFL